MSGARRLASEGVGTAALLAAVVGSGIMGERLAGGNIGLALLANSLATGAMLIAVINTFAAVSGAHFNPLVSFAAAQQRALPWSTAWAYAAVQTVGAVAGVLVAHLMFDASLITLSQKVRTGPAQWLSELVATFGLIIVVLRCAGRPAPQSAIVIAAYIVAAYWFTASTSIANPAVTLARTLTDTFAGIRPVDAPPFIVAQALGAALAVAFGRWLLVRTDKGAPTG